MKNQNHINRREFLSKTTMASMGISIISSTAMGKVLGYKAPSDKLNIAFVGLGPKGINNARDCDAENILALCDVDITKVESLSEKYPSAKQYSDWRKMYDELGKAIDAVVVSTPDHTHAIIAAHAILQGKHVYVEKPLTLTVYESRLLTKLASKYNVATQMGNQGASAEGVRQICEWIWDNQIGEIREVHAWTNRPTWPQALLRPIEFVPTPETLDWDSYLGPAPFRPYHPCYTPFNWRAWWDFGTGALGDMACHILDPVFRALKLQYPTWVTASSTKINTETAPQAEMVHLVYPEREKIGTFNLPEVKVTWYDGGLLPERPFELSDGEIMGDPNGGVLFVGSKDKLMCGCYGANPFLLSGRTPYSPKVMRVAEEHHKDWIRACKESSEHRIPCYSDFEIAGPFNEMVVMGVVAVRLQSLNKWLKWDGENIRFSNINSTDVITTSNGNPSITEKNIEENAQQAANRFINYDYREGWTLPKV